ncbi:hypothetical protein [Pseudomonas petrae]|uniref:Uncharacterized protein n=1 Tax=Pseudomonas petrae TaxID=2912190 RepID=A0ABS9I6L7_9PSED|nr:hypothetical protein [Pseudomonas petrae]MCF7543402.1 hypothetical protein [Pseudomonas petrae]
MQPADGRSITQLLEGSELSWDKTYLNIEVRSGCSESEIALFCSALATFGYDDKVERSDAGGAPVLSISNEVRKWQSSRSLYFYANLESFWGDFTKDSKIENYYYVTAEKSTNLPGSSTPLSEKINAYVLWRKLLESLADHVGTRSSINEFIYFIGSDSSAKKYDINPVISLSDFECAFASDSTSVATELLAHLELLDAHRLERRTVMRTALAEILNEDHAQDGFIWVVSQGARFFKKYREHYDNYTHRFSINKLLSEIEERNLEYTNKINESVTGSQTKAFAIPGALVAIAALLKSAEIMDVLLIFVGLLMVKSFTSTANAIYVESYGNLKRQVINGFEKYKKTSVAEEVQESASVTQVEILSLVKKAVERLGYIDKIARYMLLAGGAYLIYRVYMSPQDGQIKVYWVQLQPYLVDAFQWLKERWVAVVAAN